MSVCPLGTRLQTSRRARLRAGQSEPTKKNANSLKKWQKDYQHFALRNAVYYKGRVYVPVKGMIVMEILVDCNYL